MRISLALILVSLFMLTGCESIIHGLVEAESQRTNSKDKQQYLGGPPNFSDPELQRYRHKYLAEKSIYLKNPKDFLNVVGKGKPCKLGKTFRNKIIGIPTAKQRRVTKKIMDRIYAERPSFPRTTTTYTKPKFILLSGKCIRGKLHGDARYYTSYYINTLDKFGHFQRRMVREAIIETHFSHGKERGLRFVKGRDNYTYYESKGKRRMSIVTFDFNRAGRKPPYTNLRFFFFSKDVATQGPQVDNTNIVRAERGNWIFSKLYKGRLLFTSSSMKDGQAHGLQVTPAQKFSKFTVPEQRTCYKNGRAIKTLTCNVQ